MSNSPQINIPFANVGGFCFNVNSLIGIDLSEYEPGLEGRNIVLLLLGPHTHVFDTTEAADEFYRWYLQITGQAKIVEAMPLPGNPFSKVT